MGNAKDIDSLMKYLNTQKNIKCSGDHDKTILRNMGYFHGYKGYRIYQTVELPISSIDELSIIEEYDMMLKTIIYPQIMFVETTLKNYCIEEIINITQSDSLLDCYNSAMVRYKDFSGNQKKQAYQKRLEVRSVIYQELKKHYSNNNNIVAHFYDNNKPVPIWAIIELLTLGEFAKLMSTLDKNIIQNLNSNFGIRLADDNNYSTLYKYMYLIKSLRNSVAHNDIIYDGRFVDGYASRQIQNIIQTRYNIINITFEYLEDYIILIVFFLQGMNCEKEKIKKFINDIIDSVINFEHKLNNACITQSYVHTNRITTKLNQLLQQI